MNRHGSGIQGTKERKDRVRMGSGVEQAADT
jgi:hypothetical protein